MMTKFWVLCLTLSCFNWSNVSFDSSLHCFLLLFALSFPGKAAHEFTSPLSGALIKPSVYHESVHGYMWAHVSPNHSSELRDACRATGASETMRVETLLQSHPPNVSDLWIIQSCRKSNKYLIPFYYAEQSQCEITRNRWLLADRPARVL